MKKLLLIAAGLAASGALVAHSTNQGIETVVFLSAIGIVLFVVGIVEN